MSTGDAVEISRVVRQDEFGVRIGEVTLADPDGSQWRRAYLHTPDVVAIVAIQDGELVLVREFRPAVGQWVLALPMGKLPGGVDPIAQAAAELGEETGLRAGRLESVATLLACPGWMDQILHVFYASDLSQWDVRPVSDDPDDADDLEIEIVRLPLAQLDAAIASGRLRDARTIAAVHVTTAHIARSLEG